MILNNLSINTEYPQPFRVGNIIVYKMVTSNYLFLIPCSTLEPLTENGIEETNTITNKSLKVITEQY